MNVIAKNEDVISKLTGNETLLDGEVKGLSIFLEDDDLVITVDVKIRRKKSKFKSIKIKFLEVEEYSFYYVASIFFYNIERVKLFSLERGNFYLSLDPYDDKQEMDERDQDFIISKRLELIVN